MIRCVICGCSRLDAKGYKCARCGGAPRSFRKRAEKDSQERLPIFSVNTPLPDIGCENHPESKRAGTQDQARRLGRAHFGWQNQSFEENTNGRERKPQTGCVERVGLNPSEEA